MYAARCLGEGVRASRVMQYFLNIKKMRFIIIEDRIFKVSEDKFRKIKNAQKSGDENDLIEHFEKNQQHYTFVGYVEFSFRA